VAGTELVSGAGASRRGDILRVCVTCRWQGLETLPGTDLRPGRRLFDLVVERLGGAPPTVQPICCLSNCFRACNAVITGRGKAAVMHSEMAPDAATADRLIAAYDRFQGSDDGLTGADGPLPGTLNVLRPASGRRR
jgi:predicted metal-binding protein